MSIYLTGSLAYDRLMRFSGKFADSILPEQIESLSVSFFIDHFEEKLGGNAGNIAYSLYLLGEKPIIVASAGKDFGPYKSMLEEWGLPTHGITVHENQLTAGCYITTDLVNNQIAAFHAAALMEPSTFVFPAMNAATDIGIICPSNPNDMTTHPREYKEQGVAYIYDPAQQLPILSKEDVLASVDGALLLMGNDYEINLVMEKTGRTLAELLQMTTQGIIATMGEKGSVLYHKDGSQTHVEAVPVAEVRDPTGAGDAYRAGLLKGLTQGSTLLEAARLGAVCAAYCIEVSGPQAHVFTDGTFKKRYNSAFPA